MARTIGIRILFGLCLASPAAVQAQWRCDCTTIVSSCAAHVDARETWIEVTSDTRQCSRVDYFVDGLPFVTTVVEGRGRADWISPRPNPNVQVQSCQVCADNALAGEPRSPSGSDAAAAEERPLEPLIRWSAQYPEQAQVRGVEGHATVEFDVTAEGLVDNAAIVESEPGEVFDAAALDAVRRWRYAPDPERPTTHLSERIEFRLGDMIFGLRPTPTEAEAGDTPSVPRNTCIHEDAVYDYGEMIEAGLINACAEPLLVYGCAEGTGRQAQRWVCTDSERLESVLVRPGDARVGDTVQVGRETGGIDWLEYVDSFYVARAPNSQYWWVACTPADEACREDARMWVRSTDRQPASINPRARASIDVAGSY